VTLKPKKAAASTHKVPCIIICLETGKKESIYVMTSSIFKQEKNEIRDNIS
jgi:hypothetical protein